MPRTKEHPIPYNKEIANNRWDQFTSCTGLMMIHMSTPYTSFPSWLMLERSLYRVQTASGSQWLTIFANAATCDVCSYQKDMLLYIFMSQRQSCHVLAMRIIYRLQTLTTQRVLCFILLTCKHLFYAWLYYYYVFGANVTIIVSHKEGHMQKM